MDLCLTLHTNVDSRWSYELNVKDKTIQLAEDSGGKYYIPGA